MSPKERLISYIKQCCLIPGRFILSGGWTTTTWIDVARLYGDSVDGRPLLLNAIMEQLKNEKIQHITCSEIDLPMGLLLAQSLGISVGAIPGQKTSLRMNGALPVIPMLNQIQGMLPTIDQATIIVNMVVGSCDSLKRCIDFMDTAVARIQTIMPIIDASANNEAENIAKRMAINFKPLLTAADLGIGPAIAPPGFAGTASSTPQQQGEMNPKDQPPIPVATVLEDGDA